LGDVFVDLARGISESIAEPRAQESRHDEYGQSHGTHLSIGKRHARLLVGKVSPRTVRRAIEAGRLKASKLPGGGACVSGPRMQTRR
jgi:hypothetical protein